MISRWTKAVSKTDLETTRLLTTIDRTQAVIQFKPDGTIIEANDNFLGAMGYSLEEVSGQHHSIFVDSEYRDSEEYQDFWSDLAAGNDRAGQFPRISKSGATIWIQAMYAPVFDENGRVDRVVKLATDVTKRREAVAGIAAALVQLSDGDLGHRVAQSGVAEIDEIGLAFNQASEQLGAALRTILDVSSAVETVVKAVDASSDELSARTTNQAATLEETAAALEELTVTVKSSAAGAAEAETMASDTKLTAERSEAVVSQSISAMSDIQKSSDQISQIISVIDDIAFQTNLLALNAGVEAARAGEKGRGFAVVAAEVRGLAHRSQEAAGEIKNLISQSSEHVAKGVTLVNDAATELTKIISSVNAISGKVSTISNSSSEQSTALSEINIGVSDLDSVTQQNAGMVGQVSSSNKSLMQQVNNMAVQIHKFRFGGQAENLTEAEFRSAG